VYRVAGQVDDQGMVRPWSLILKIVHVPTEQKESDPAGLVYWQRELLAYQSGLLSHLPGGLAAPRCLGVMEQADQTRWLWLEEITDLYGAHWPLSLYPLAAQHLGRFNGAHLAGQPIPAEPWLNTQMLRAWLAMNTTAMTQLPEVIGHPLVQCAFPAQSASRLMELWADCEVLLAALERLPQTFCHLDAWRRNLFFRQESTGEAQLVAIDWEFAGLGALGQELAALVALSLHFFAVDVADRRDLDTSTFAGYLAGLGDAGWHGDPQTVRFAYTAAAALRHGVGATAYTLHLALDDSSEAWVTQTYGWPREEVLTCHGILLEFLLDRADEARALLRHV
jgi:hypothetical protein